MPEIIITHGTPGSGKSTHSERITTTPLDARPVFHISAGDRLRGIRTGSVPSVYKSAIDTQAAALLESAPLEHWVVNGVVFEFINQCPAFSIVIVDGYPRFLKQLDLLATSIVGGNHILLGCINLKISEGICLARLTDRGSREGEKGISKAFVTQRFFEYSTHTTETIKALGENIPVIPIDAEPNMEDVWGSFCTAFRELARIN